MTCAHLIRRRTGKRSSTCWPEHRDAGLPPAVDIIRDTFRAVAEPDRQAPGLPVIVLRIWAEHFSWTAREEFGADVLIDALDSDDGVAALAEFLWAVQGRTPADRPSDMCEN